MWLLLLACSAEFVGGSDPATLEAWGGPAGAYLELAPIGEPDSPALLIEIDRDGWDLRYGTGWSGAQELGARGLVIDELGYAVGESLLVPAPVEEGASAQGSTILRRGELEVWYGTFPDAIEVEVGGGELAGEAAFGAGIGPLRLTWQGRAWELVYYE